MNALLTDPVVLICAGIIVFGIVGLFWAVGKYRGLGTTMAVDEVPASDFLPIQRPEEEEIPAFTPPPRPTPVAAPVIGRDVAERLDSMTARLAEMQAVLKQSSTATVSTAGGPVGQGFSPETVDKLLKIIGNVIQQVDILQKSLHSAKDDAAVSESVPLSKI